MTKIDWSKVITKEQAIEEANAVKRDAFTSERNKRLADTDWVILRNLETNEPVPESWLTYRQALRDLPSVVKDYDNIDWPVKPE